MLRKIAGKVEEGYAGPMAAIISLVQVQFLLPFTPAREEKMKSMLLMVGRQCHRTLGLPRIKLVNPCF